MRISSVIGLYFSPTGTTRTLVTAAAEQAAQTLGVPFRLISLNTPAERETVFHFSADTLVIVGAPTYAGRLPNKISPDLRRILHTREVRPITLDGQRVEEDTISSVSLFFFAYMIILFFSALIVSLDELDFTSAFTASLTCISNVGPGLGILGPMENFSILSPLSKLVLSLEMLTGRLELMPMLALMTRGAWSDR